MTQEKDNDLGCPKKGWDYWNDYRDWLRQLKEGMKGEENRMIDNLTIAEIKAIMQRLEWNDEFKKDGRLWLAEARKIRDRYGLTDKEVLDIANNRLKL